MAVRLILKRQPSLADSQGLAAAEQHSAGRRGRRLLPRNGLRERFGVPGQRRRGEQRGDRRCAGPVCGGHGVSRKLCRRRRVPACTAASSLCRCSRQFLADPRLSAPATADGGAISVGNVASLQSVVFKENSAGRSGGAVFSSRALEGSNVTAVGNVAGLHGGAFLLNGSAVMLDGGAPSVLEGNRAAGGIGGAIFGSSPTDAISLAGLAVRRNTAYVAGGAAYCRSNSTSVSNSTFAEKCGCAPSAQVALSSELAAPVNPSKTCLPCLRDYLTRRFVRFVSQPFERPVLLRGRVRNRLDVWRLSLLPQRHFPPQRCARLPRERARRL